MPKPLLPVGGVPLIEHVIANFAAAGIESVTLIFNEDEADCADYVRSRFADLDLAVLIQTTRSSLESFREVARRLAAGRALVSTVDAWCPRPDFLDFLAAASRTPPGATVLAVTPFVADERPLWASLNRAGRITSLGGSSGEVVTAGMYVVPEHIRSLSPPASLERLRDFLVWLFNRGEPLYGISIPTVVDVDRSADVALAEALAGRATSGRVGNAK